jgi:hypothetical protein
MASLPAVRLEMLLGGVWVDMAAVPPRLDGDAPTSRLLWSESGSPLEITRGVGDDGGVASGTLDCVLENNDGALTPNKLTSPFWPYLVKYRMIRVGTYVAGAWRYRFTGWVSGEPLSWPLAPASVCNVALSATDLIGMMYRPLRSVAVEATAERGPLAYWPLTDSEATSAADQSGNNRPGLAVQRYGSGTDGSLSWSSGVVLPTDNAGGLVFEPSTEHGFYLLSVGAVDLPTSWSLSVIVTPAAKDGYVCQIGTGQYSIGIWYDTSAKKLSAIETLLNSSGDPVDYVLSTSTAAWTGGMETLTVTPTTVTLGSSSTTGSRHSSDRMLGSLVSVGGAMAVESGRARLYSGELKHLAVWSDTVPSGVDADTLTGPSDLLTMSTAIARIIRWSGIAMPVWRTNLCTNPSFEVNTSGWGALGSSVLTRTTAEAHRGSASLQVVTGGVAASEGACTVPLGNPSPGSVYSGSVWVKAPARTALYAFIRPGLPPDDVRVYFTATGAWQQVKVEPAAAIGSGGSPVLQMGVRTTTQQVVTFYLDEMIVEATASTDSYFDGSFSPNMVALTAAWSGTANASQSTLTAIPVTTRGTNLGVQLLKIEGMTGADILAAYGQGTMARVAANGYGGITVAAWDYQPAPIAPPAGDIDPDTDWGAAADETDGVTVTWSDGSTYTAGTGELGLTGVLDSVNGQAVADWIVAASANEPRFPGAVYHLLVLADSEAANLYNLDIGSSLAIPGLPGQLPAATQTGIVEAIVETIGADQWDLEATTAADDRLAALIVGDATYGVVGVGQRAAPLGPNTAPAGAGWKAGQTIDANTLNNLGYQGGTMQSGAVTITPVANSPTSAAVTFSPAFASAPAVVVGYVGGYPGSQVQGISMAGVTATGRNIWVYRTTADPVIVDWFAVGS